MTVHRFYHPASVTRQIWGGRTLLRSLFHLALQRHIVRGRILDLGSKTSGGNYYTHLSVAPGSEIVHTDLVEAEGVVALDVEERFPFPDDVFDVVLAFHLLEHVFHFDRVPGEVRRLLKPGGRVFVSTPLLYEYHPDPEDYLRFTDTALRKLWEDAGFRCVWMEALGEGLLTLAVTRLSSLALPSVLRGPAAASLYLATTFFDRLIDRLRPSIHGRGVAARFALGHLAIFEKA